MVPLERMACYLARFKGTRPADPTPDFDASAHSYEAPKYVATGDPKPNHVRVVCISDTHCRPVRVPAGDVLVHCGDMTMGGRDELDDFARWFNDIDIKHKVVIAGNHDELLDSERCAALGDECHLDAFRTSLEAHYLEDSGCTVAGLRFWGSPFQPAYGDWAFQLARGEPCRERWSRVPAGIDVLVTHGPPLGRGDRCYNGKRAGCQDLLDEVQNRVRPRVHVFGHIHEGFGVSSDGVTDFVNAATCNLRYQPIHRPVVLDIPLG